MRKMMVNIQRALPANRRNVTYMLGIFAILYVLLLYLLGIHFGFYRATVRLSLKTITKFILPTTFFIIITEYIREKILQKNIKYKKLIAYLLVVILEILVNGGKYDLTSSKDFLALTGYIIFVAITNNLLFNYISIRYGKMPNIIYRFIISLYVYIIPITPDVHMLICTFIKMILPYIIYVILEYTYPEKEVFVPSTVKRKIGIINVVLILSMIIITMLVSCKFKFGILVIGSESMTGTINKGDAVIFEQYKNQKISKGQIILFKTETKIIVHRVIDVKNVNNEMRYYTKGDANPANDSGYVTNSDLIGIYRTKINKIGYLTLWFNDIFKK